MSICKNLVDMLGGKIWIKSEINKGFVFYISIPK
ncbi:MAG: HAMP domain-containing histidine kinase [Salinivirgaceae bacterium]|nr:HAMP domain-containing histidine kinase [Salinivirgaceae bacterium]